jgi:thiol-disulfide isomerase/thioredoxin
MFTLLLSAAVSSARAAPPEMIPASAMDEVGHIATDLDVPLKDGSRFKLSDHKGKLVVMSFWASWCTPCRKELPALSKLAQERTDIIFVAVNVDRDRSLAEKFLEKVDVTIPIAFDSDATALGSYGVTSMPTLFLVDKQGNVALKKVGYGEESGFTELLAAVEKTK